MTSRSLHACGPGIEHWVGPSHSHACTGDHDPETIKRDLRAHAYMAKVCSSNLGLPTSMEASSSTPFQSTAKIKHKLVYLLHSNVDDFCHTRESERLHNQSSGTRLVHDTDSGKKISRLDATSTCYSQGSLIAHRNVRIRGCPGWRPL